MDSHRATCSGVTATKPIEMTSRGSVRLCALNTLVGLHPCPGLIGERQQGLRHAEQAHRGPRYAVEALLTGRLENLERVERFQSLRLEARHEDSQSISVTVRPFHMPRWGEPYARARGRERREAARQA